MVEAEKALADESGDDQESRRHGRLRGDEDSCSAPPVESETADPPQSLGAGERGGRDRGQGKCQSEAERSELDFPQARYRARIEKLGGVHEGISQQSRENGCRPSDDECLGDCCAQKSREAGPQGATRRELLISGDSSSEPQMKPR